MCHRALKAWERIHIPGEGVPLPGEFCYVVARWLRENGGELEALLVESALDMYFRGQEWSMLRARDVYYDDDKVAVILGVAERGERVKTGRNQGITIDSKVLQAEWRARKAALDPDAAFFPFSPDHFRQRWHAAKHALGLSWGGPPHHLRHAGAARDIEKKSRTLEEVRIRGRWKHIESVQR